jgi:transcriptional regulator with XRE-family HTH domain
MRKFIHQTTLLKIKRKEAGLSQRDLGLRLGYKDAQFISNCERGKSGLPLGILEKICVVLDIPKIDMKYAVLKDWEEDIDSILIIQ